MGTPTFVQPRLLTVQQAAQYLSSTPWFVRSLHWDRKVRGIKMGKRLVFDRTDLDAYIEQRKVAA